jgi:HPt (histidine-containing phosphotransfer) domain-containing protein
MGLCVLQIRSNEATLRLKEFSAARCGDKTSSSACFSVRELVVKTKILLVADDTPRAATIRTLLDTHGHDVFHAKNPAEASEALEIQRFQFVLWDSAKGRALNPQILNTFRGPAKGRHSPLLVVIRGDVASAKPLHLAGAEPGVDAVIEGRFSAIQLVEIVDDLLRNRSLPSSPAAQIATEGSLPVFEREQFERQMNYDRRLMSEIIQLFVTETNLQIAALQSALDAGLDAQVRGLAHTLKGSFGAAYAHQAGAVAREMEAAATGDLSSARKIMPRLKRATAEIQRQLEQLLAE